MDKLLVYIFLNLLKFSLEYRFGPYKITVNYLLYPFF